MADHASVELVDRARWVRIVEGVEGRHRHRRIRVVVPIGLEQVVGVERAVPHVHVSPPIGIDKLTVKVEVTPLIISRIV